MGALNKTETEALGAVDRVLFLVMRDGFNPEAKDEKSKELRVLLTQSRKAVRTIKEMKGYFLK